VIITSVVNLAAVQKKNASLWLRHAAADAESKVLAPTGLSERERERERERKAGIKNRVHHSYIEGPHSNTWPQKKKRKILQFIKINKIFGLMVSY